MTTIDFEKCETLLREKYNISNDTLLYMKKIDVAQEGMRTSKIEYNIYCKLNGTNLVRLDLSVCKDIKISFSIPIKLTENINELNASSGYFNDICYKATSDSGTDIVIKDRRANLIEGNKTVCQEHCDFTNYSAEDQIVNCSCLVKESSNSYGNMNINKTELYENFENIGNKYEFSNLGITSCKVLSSKEDIKSNSGFYSLLIILIIFIIIFIAFCLKGYNLLENKIDEVIYKKFGKEEKSTNKKSKTKKTILIQRSIPTKSTKKSKTKGNRKTKQVKNSFSTSNRLKLNRTQNNNFRAKNILSLNKNANKNKNSKLTKKKDLKPDIDYELNWLSYKDAINYDKRSNCEYYGSLLRSKQLFIFTFCSFNDYNSGIIKKFIFFLSFAMHYTVNALFFNEANIHQIYKDEGKYNFGYQVSFIIYSAIISNVVLRLMLQFLVLTDKDILQVKLKKTKDDAIRKKKDRIKCMKKKFAIFFILNFCLLVLFWYYLTCFNAIYKNTQIYLIENTFICFAISLFYPFIINIIPTLLRMGSIHSSNKDQECLYKISQIIQLI